MHMCMARQAARVAPSRQPPPRTGKAAACAGCPNQAACASGQGAALDPDAGAIRDRMASVDYKVLVLSGKGGVGKSTLASQLAMLDGRRVRGAVGGASCTTYYRCTTTGGLQLILHIH